MIVTINDDFDQEKIRVSGQAFRINICSDGSYKYIHKGNILHLRQMSKNEYDADCTKGEWQDIWMKYFDFDRCYSSIRKSINSDDHFLISSANAGKGIRILRQDPFEMLITFIISQRKNIPAITSSVEKICTNFGEKLSDTDYAFPTPKALFNADEEILKACSLGYRLAYVRDAAKKVYHGDLDLFKINALSDEELFETLKTVHGVGDKVSNCICLFGYGRCGMAPIDTWINKVITEQYNGVNPFPRYGKNAGIMQQYMFYHARI